MKHTEDWSVKVDFIAQLTFRTTAEGGRKTPARSGYRPQAKFSFDKMVTSGIQTYIGTDTVFPGDTVEAQIKILGTDYFAGRLTEGMAFDFCEGPVIIGTGIIKTIVNESLKE